ncbi:MAG: hypothetical protein ACLFTB_00660 [Desulfovibrionales bacterium]
MNRLKIPAQSLVAFGVLGLILVLGCVFLVLPKFSENAALERQIEQARAAVEEQKALFPVYADLAARAEKAKGISLPSPEHTDLNIEEIEYIPELVRKKAEQSGIESISITPDPKSLESSGLLKVNCEVRGQFVDFRAFLIRLGELSSLRQIEQISIRPVRGSREMRLTLWLGLSGEAVKVSNEEGRQQAEGTI